MKRDLKKHSVKGNGMRNLMSRGVSGLLALAFCGIAHAFLFPQLGIELVPQIKSAVVMTRAQVLGENGGPILVVTRSSGDSNGASTEEIEEIGEVYTGSELDGIYILSGAEVGYFLDQYARFNIERGETMKRAEFLPAKALASGLKVANGATSEQVHYPDHIKTVLVLGERDRFGTDPARWTLLEVPFLMKKDTALEASASSVLFDEEGKVLRTVSGVTQEDGSFEVEAFTYRVAYFGEGDEALKQADYLLRKHPDRVFGPVANARLDMLWTEARSGSDGRFSLFHLNRCLGIRVPEFLPLQGTTDVTLSMEVRAAAYNPRGVLYLPMLMQKSTYLHCSTNISVRDTPDFVIDLLWLHGQLRMANTANGESLPIGDEILYQGEDRSGDPIAQSHFDFDGDGEPDISVLANKKTETDDETGERYVIPNQEGEDDTKPWQAVYFSSGSHSPNAESLAEQVPDLWRLADRTLDTEETGLLSQISAAALVNTDVYIFRESSGELIVEVNGLPKGSENDSDILGDDGHYYGFDTVIRGTKQHGLKNNLCKGKRGDDCNLINTVYDGRGDSETALLTRNGTDAFAEDNEQLGFSSRFQQRDSGLPAPGEWLYVVAINRTTGYTGTTRFQLGQPYGQGAKHESVTQTLPDITLTPPNLKVWAKRVYDIENGLTKDETVNYLIGHEGGATQDDTLIGIYTEWLDSEGRPLPTGLDTNQGKDFGLSGRLAKIAGDELVPVSSGIAVEADDFDIEEAQQGSKVVEFPISPGQRLQVLRLKADNISNEHYYVNVFGRAINKEACSHCEFDNADKQQDLLTGRPNHYTPFYVPRYDEQATLELRQERDKLLNEQIAAGVPIGERSSKAESQYQWMLRPEYQFSLIDLTIDELHAIHYETDENGERQEIVRNLLDDNVPPIISKHDDLIRAFYDLVLPDSDPLPGFDGTRQYVLSFGEDEQELTMQLGQNGLEFSSIEHLGQLLSLSSPSDLLTLRVFLHDDPGNVLWQWAFVKNGLRVEFEHPAEKILLKPRRSQEQPDVQEEGYYTLGGARLRLSYDFPYGSVPLYLSISVSRPGYVCKTFHKDRLSDGDDFCVRVFANAPLDGIFNAWTNDDQSAGPEAAEDWFVYWEPEEWSAALDARISVSVGYIQAQKALIQATLRPLPIEAVSVDITKTTVEPMETWLRSRQLDPSATPRQQGPDVAILEAMLWQLGLSPQRGGDYRRMSNAGAEGARIASNRSGAGSVNTVTCQGQSADRRDIFYSGWGSECPAGHVSLEGMVRRFYGRNFTAGDGEGYDAYYAGVEGASGNVDSVLLERLETIWNEYVRAYSKEPSHASNPAIGFHSPQIDSWITQAMDIWQSGDAAQGIVPTYTDTEHQATLSATEQAHNSTLTRLALFRAWKAQEATHHWGGNGKGYQATPFRVTEGGGDEVGSMGFSQIKYAYRYGHADLRCAGLQKFNLFEPIDAIRGMMAFVAVTADAANKNCGRSFSRVIAATGDWHGATPGEGTALRGYLLVDDTVNSFAQTAATRIDDAYERLMRGLAGYNGHTGINRPWAIMLTTSARGGATRNRGYAIEVMRRFGVPARTYVWRGGVYPDFMTGGEGNQIPHPNAGEEWCFAYGEREWMDPENNPITGTPMNYQGYRDRAEQIKSRRKSCN